MKITKRQLKRIIKEERAKILKEYGSDPYMDAMMDLYDTLEVAFAKAKKAGIDYTDLVTAIDDAKNDTGY